VYTHTLSLSLSQYAEVSGCEACHATGFGHQMNSLKNVDVKMEGKRAIQYKTLS
jgi:hypothetical protein